LSIEHFIIRLNIEPLHGSFKKPFIHPRIKTRAIDILSLRDKAIINKQKNLPPKSHL